MAINCRGILTTVLYNTNESEKIKKLSDEKVDDVDFSKDTINIISVAKIVPSKGYDRLMKIHKKLIEKNIKNHIYILATDTPLFLICKILITSLYKSA